MVLDTATPRHHLAKSTDQILAAADRAEPKIRRALLTALDELEDQLPDLSGLIASGDSAAVMREVAALQVPQPLRDAIVDATVNSAIQAAAPELASFPVSFNNPNQRAVRWAELNAAKNIKAGSVSPATRGAIRDVVVNAIQQGVHPRKTARIVEGMVPLLPQHAQSVSRFVDGALDAGLDQSHIDRVVARKTRKLKRYRANMIARTEAIKSANMGQQLVWESAIDEGLIPAGTKKVWVATGDDRTCKICAVMDGQTVEVVGEFGVKEQATGFRRDGADFRVTGTKPLKRPASPKTPPAHPQCRCTIVLESIPAPGQRPATQSTPSAAQPPIGSYDDFAEWGKRRGVNVSTGPNADLITAEQLNDFAATVDKLEDRLPVMKGEWGDDHPIFTYRNKPRGIQEVVVGGTDFGAGAVVDAPIKYAGTGGSRVTLMPVRGAVSGTNLATDYVDLVTHEMGHVVHRAIGQTDRVGDPGSFDGIIARVRQAVWPKGGRGIDRQTIRDDLSEYAMSHNDPRQERREFFSELFAARNSPTARAQLSSDAVSRVDEAAALINEEVRDIFGITSPAI